MTLIALTASRFLRELQQRQRQTALNMSICDIVLKYVSVLHSLVAPPTDMWVPAHSFQAEDDFGCYIPYCTNQVYQIRELRELTLVTP